MQVKCKIINTKEQAPFVEWYENFVQGELYARSASYVAVEL